MSHKQQALSSKGKIKNKKGAIVECSFRISYFNCKNVVKYHKYLYWDQKVQTTDHAPCQAKVFLWACGTVDGVAATVIYGNRKTCTELNGAQSHCGLRKREGRVISSSLQTLKEDDSQRYSGKVNCIYLELLFFFFSFTVNITKKLNLFLKLCRSKDNKSTHWEKH